MSVRMRHTRGHTNNRRSHHALEVARPVASENGTYKLPHRVDEATGLYRGRQVAAPAKAKRPKSETHDHPSGTHHEHVEHAEHSEHKPAEAIEAERQAPHAGEPRNRSGQMGGGK